jgi:hypothetical protein
LVLSPDKLLAKRDRDRTAKSEQSGKFVPLQCTHFLDDVDTEKNTGLLYLVVLSARPLSFFCRTRCPRTFYRKRPRTAYLLSCGGIRRNNAISSTAAKYALGLKPLPPVVGIAFKSVLDVVFVQRGICRGSHVACHHVVIRTGRTQCAPGLNPSVSLDTTLRPRRLGNPRSEPLVQFRSWQRNEVLDFEFICGMNQGSAEVS